MVVPHWSGRNSMIVSWWCLIGQDVIPRWFRGGASLVKTIFHDGCVVVAHDHDVIP